jgi:transcriptional regulator with XRE-family HTH domain
MFTNLTPEKIGDNLKHLIRESKYRTQEEFACAAGADVRTVRRWVQKLDSISTIVHIAKVLQVDVTALLC